ncbi:putative metal-binding protein [Oleiphilus messinensis]|uniref:Putative metal-binding protein n=1 Tax=Oleiphilus messinensis TaxID=141451 RepID=A0A1Y0I7S9_9GAMM|nr:YecA family protein [Oleiphilus messinensis]ARU56280.1 putative metal-binding protein [Oleiphilus messinensis]
MLNEIELNELDDFLFSEEVSDVTLDYFGLHGLLCALVAGPVNPKLTDVTHLIFGEFEEGQTAHTPIPERVLQLMQKLYQSIAAELQNENAVELPVDDEESFELSIRHWCAGFIEGFLAYEEKWIEADESKIADLLLPIMVLSELFEDEEFDDIRRNEDLVDQFTENLPDAVTDIYLHFHGK